MRRMAACCIWLALLAGGPAASGGVGDSAILGLEVGIGGAYKAGLWTPIRVDYRLAHDVTDARLELIVADGDGVPSRYLAPLPCPQPGGEESSASGGSSSATIYARPGRVHGTIDVRLRTSAGRPIEKVFRAGDADPGRAFAAAIGSDQKLVVVVGTKPAGLAEAVRLLHQSPEEKTVIARLDRFADLPHRWYGYEAVDTVVLTTSDLEPYAGLTADAAPLMALTD